MALVTNDKEAFALENFRAAVENLKLDDGILMRFLRAHNLDQSKAEESLSSYLKWRKDNIYESSLQIGWEPPAAFISKFEIFQTGLDHEGRPVFYLYFDTWFPIRELFSKFSKFQFLQYAYYCMKTLLDQIHKRTKHQQFIFLLDNKGLGFAKIFHEVQNWVEIQTLIELYEILESRFPESLNKGFFINTPRAFLWGFSLVKHFLTERTLSKISIYGSDEDLWKPVMFECLPENAIPELYGGTAKLTNIKDVVFGGKTIF